MSAVRTPGPWAICADGGAVEIVATSPFARIAELWLKENTHDDAMHIVEACNNYERVCNQLAVLHAEYATVRSEFAAVFSDRERVCAERDAFSDNYDELREILKDIVDMDAEEWAIGGGPNWQERKAKAWARAREVFEP